MKYSLEGIEKKPRQFFRKSRKKKKRQKAGGEKRRNRRKKDIKMIQEKRFSIKIPRKTDILPRQSIEGRKLWHIQKKFTRTERHDFLEPSQNAKSSTQHPEKHRQEDTMSNFRTPEIKMLHISREMREKRRKKHDSYAKDHESKWLQQH